MPRRRRLRVRRRRLAFGFEDLTMEVLVDTADKLASSSRMTTAVPEGMIASQRRSDSDDDYPRDQVIQGKVEGPQGLNQSLQGQEQSRQGEEGQSLPDQGLPRLHELPQSAVGGDFDDGKGYDNDS